MNRIVDTAIFIVLFPVFILALGLRGIARFVRWATPTLKSNHD